MPKDYKHRAQKGDSGGGGCGRCLFHFVGGLLLGGFLVGAFWLYNDPALLRSGRALDRAGVPRPPKEVVADTPRPDYYFIDNLSRVEVEVPPPERRRPGRAPPPAKAATETTPTTSAQTAAGDQDQGRYLLQLGSFRRRADAERVKAEVAFLGAHARVTKVRVGGNDYYRVRIGPIEGRKAMEKARQRLREHHIESIPIRLK